MYPLDALCELIDNAIDSFNTAKIQGVTPIDTPIINVTLPRRKQLEEGGGVLRVQDNGPGMTAENAEKAIKAGFSGNNPYDSLGLFGMGFNISTGKLGNITTLITTREDSPTYIRTVINLEKINQTKDYQLDVDEVTKKDGEPFNVGDHGTIIEVSDWWPKGNENNGFVQKLVNYGNPKICSELGRRYATILREGKLSIVVNGQKCTPFEHCVWSDIRYVTRRKEKIPAVIHLDQTLGSDKRCSQCTAIIGPGETTCPSCGSTTFRTIKKQVKGWIGVQRFEDKNKFGIDLIRNGRAICIYEQDAFFKYTDEFGNEEKDYPIDSTMGMGRIVGEIQLDFVPVDFLKKDFQRSSAEWQEAIEFIRGKSSLQPTKEGASENHSPMFQLYQGYRRVKEFGRGDMYMGYWDPNEHKGKRISREVIDEYYQKFLKRVPGYYDDTEWWKLVEAADQPPVEAYKTCSQCGAQNLESADECIVCGTSFRQKECVNEDCKKLIPANAQQCPYCGTDQTILIVEPWTCNICGTRNIGTNDTCSTCGKERGLPNPLSEEELKNNSDKVDELSNNELVINIADDVRTNPLRVEVYATKKSILTPIENRPLPLQVFKNIGAIKVFLDLNHPMFSTMDVIPEQVVASEVAMYLYDEWRSNAGKPEHNLSIITYKVLEANWKDELELSPDYVSKDAMDLLDDILERIRLNISNEEKAYYYSELSDTDKKALTNALINDGIALESIGILKESGDYLKYVPYSFIMTIFDQSPDLFFDGNVWKQSLASDSAELLGRENVEEFQNKVIGQYKGCLQDLIDYCENKYVDMITMKRVKLSVEFLRRGMME